LRGAAGRPLAATLLQRNKSDRTASCSAV